MESVDGQEIYLKTYIQRQENLLLDFMRKLLDYEIKISALEKTIKDLNLKYEESQKQIEIQNNMMQQAASGLENVSLEKINLENKLKEKEQKYKERVEYVEKMMIELKQSKGELLEKLKNNDNGSDLLRKELDETKRELKRQFEELNTLYKENEELKSKLPKKNKKEAVILPPDEF